MTTTPPPSILLHDHLDGGLRPTTVIELAAEVGHGLPTTDPDELARWFQQGADQRDLVTYLDTFVHTIAVMQTPAALERVARECGHDLAADGVLYAEIRFAPELHRERGLGMDDVLSAVTAGFAQAEQDTGIVLRTLVTAMRNGPHSDEAVDAAVRWKDRGVVGFDLAGPEAGFPPSRHRAAIDVALAAGLGVTIHAGEGDGVDSVADAVACGAHRLGHGVRLVEDLDGETAQHVLQERIALEVSPSSNVHTGAASSWEAHPLEVLRQTGFAVTVNTDNRLMSATSMSQELARCATAFGWDDRVIGELAHTALDAAFCDDVVRAAVRARLDAILNES